MFFRERLFINCNGKCAYERELESKICVGSMTVAHAVVTRDVPHGVDVGENPAHIIRAILG